MAYAFLWNSLADKMLLRFLGLRVKRREAKEEGEKREESGRRGDLDGRLFFSQCTKLSLRCFLYPRMKAYRCDCLKQMFPFLLGTKSPLATPP